MSLRTISQEAFFAGQPAEPTPEQLRRCIYTPWRDVACLLRLCSIHRPERFLEVGCHRGATMVMVAEAFQCMRIVGLDPGDQVQPLERNEVQLGEYLPQGMIGELVRGRPNTAVYRCRFEDLPQIGRFDAIFIDGDHRREAVEADSRRATQILNPGGFIAWHDVGNPLTPDVEPTLAAMDLPIVRIEGTWVACTHEEGRT